MRIVGPIHYVGTKELAAYLIATPEGHVLIDGAMPASGKDVEASIRALGLAPEDIKLLLVTQVHVDHVGTLAHLKRLSRATLADGVVRRALIGACVESEAQPLDELQDGVRYDENGRNLDSTMLPVPDPLPDPSAG